MIARLTACPGGVPVMEPVQPVHIPPAWFPGTWKVCCLRCRRRARNDETIARAILNGRRFVRVRA